MDDPLTRLLIRASDGDEAALDAFVHRTQHDVWVVCRSLGDADNTEDLVQDVYVRALRAIAGYRADGPARNWLLSIARRTCADATRKRIRRRRRHDSQPFEEQAIEDADRTVVDSVLAVLDPERREAFVLTQLAGLSYEDAATVIGCPIGTVRSRVSRARRQLLPVVTEDDGSAETG